MAEPAVTELPQTRHTLGASECWSDYVFSKDLTRHFDGRELQLFLGAEMGKEAALAHLEFIRQPSDG